MTKDLYKQWRYPTFFVYLRGAINVRVVGMGLDRTSKKLQYMGVSKLRLNNKASYEENLGNRERYENSAYYPRTVVLKESDSVAVRYFGRQKGEIILRNLGNPHIR